MAKRKPHVGRFKRNTQVFEVGFEFRNTSGLHVLADFPDSNVVGRKRYRQTSVGGIGSRYTFGKGRRSRYCISRPTANVHEHNSQECANEILH